MTPGVKLHNLSLGEILKDSVAMSYFLDYMNSVGGTNHLLLFLNTHGKTVDFVWHDKWKGLIFLNNVYFFVAWKNSAITQLLAIESTNKGAALAGKDESENNQAMLECLRDSASNVYDEFMSDVVNFQIILCAVKCYMCMSL